MNSDPLLDDEIEKLKVKIERLQSETGALKEKLDNTSSGVSNYIGEMNTLLDSQDFGSLFDSILIQPSSVSAQPHPVQT